MESDETGSLSSGGANPLPITLSHARAKLPPSDVAEPYVPPAPGKVAAAPGRRQVSLKSDKPGTAEARKKAATKIVEDMRWMQGQTIAVLVNKNEGESGSRGFWIDGSKEGHSAAFDIKMQDTALHNVCYLMMMGNCENDKLEKPPKDSDWKFHSLAHIQLLNPECVSYGTGMHEGQQVHIMTERKKVGNEDPKHYYRYYCPCWNMYTGFTLAHHLEKRFLEQQFNAGVFSPKPLGLKVRPICLQTLEAIMDRGGDKRTDQLMEIMTKQVQQVWVGNVKPLKRTARFLNFVQVLHTKHRVRVTPPPTMIRWQMNKLEHNRLLLDKKLATMSAEIDVSETLRGQYNWSELLKVAIDKLVEVGKEHAEVFNGQVPVSLREPYLKRQGVVLKFNHDCRGNVFWIRYSTNTSTAATKMVVDNEESEDEEGEDDSEEEETSVAAVEVTDGPILVNLLPTNKQFCPSQSAHTRYRDSWTSFLIQAQEERVFTRPHTVIVQPYMLSLQKCENVLYYSFDQQEKLIAMAHMQFRGNGEMIPFPVDKEGPEVTPFRLIKKMNKVWKEKVTDKPNFKDELGQVITANLPWGIYKQPFLPFRVDCYTDKLYGGSKEFCVVNSLGLFPMVDLQELNGHDVVATLVMDRYCDWATRSLEGYPMA